MNPKDRLLILTVFLASLQWVVLKEMGIDLPSPWNAFFPGMAIFGAAFLLSWGAELAQFEIPRSLAVVFLALIAVLPEYAVDMYFAWQAGHDPQYIHYATANMTGANRLLIGLGWAAVVFAFFFRTRKREVPLSRENRKELFILILATLYAFIIPIKGTLSWVDSIVLLSIFGGYVLQASRSHMEEPEIEGPITAMAQWSRGARACVTLLFFIFSGYVIYIAAEPFSEGILAAGRHWGIEEFILVQWLAPLASESPEFIVAIIFALRAQASLSLSTLISSKVNQWTLLIGMLPLVYNISLGQITPMVLDGRQAEEILLTTAQSLFAIVLVANLRFSTGEAFLLFVLFASQIFFTSMEARLIYAAVYLTLALGWLLMAPTHLRGIRTMIWEGFKTKPFGKD